MNEVKKLKTGAPKTAAQLTKGEMNGGHKRALFEVQREPGRCNKSTTLS